MNLDMKYSVAEGLRGETQIHGCFQISATPKLLTFGGPTPHLIKSLKMSPHPTLNIILWGEENEKTFIIFLRFQVYSHDLNLIMFINNYLRIELNCHWPVNKVILKILS